MRKKPFDWTHQDLAEWEKVRNKGRLHFTMHYAKRLFIAILVIFLGGAAAVFLWNKAKAADVLPELIIIAVLCLVLGLGNSLVAWSVEERNYHKYKKIHHPEKTEADKPDENA